jgi:sugar transferase (PEP-CTERM system associated)
MIRVFNHYVPIQIAVLILVEALILALSIYFGSSLRFGQIALSQVSETTNFGGVAVVFSALMIATMTTFGLYQRDSMESFRAALSRVTASFMVGFAIMSLLFYVVPTLFLGRGAFGLSVIIGFFAIVLVRVAFFKWANWGLMQSRILVLGTGTRADNVEALINSQATSSNMNIVGYLPVKGGQNHVTPSRILPDETSSLYSVVKKYAVNEIVLAVRERRGGVLPMKELLECRLRGVRITELSTFFERERGQVRLDSLNASWLILGEGFNNNSLRDVVKRGFDLVASGILLAVTSPVIAITAFMIKLDSTGPLFYLQERVGEGGRVFAVCKFRSMRTDAEQAGKPIWATANDDRTTRVGRIIRKLRIDELPQIFNVFRGDMSFVGPRPERPFFVQQLAQEIPYYEARHSIKPGITGWAQVRYPYGASVEDAREKLQYDLYYVKNHSLFLDIMILIDTIQVVLWGKGAR